MIQRVKKKHATTFCSRINIVQKYDIYAILGISEE